MQPTLPEASSLPLTAVKHYPVSQFRICAGSFAVEGNEKKRKKKKMGTVPSGDASEQFNCRVRTTICESGCSLLRMARSDSVQSIANGEESSLNRLQCVSNGTPNKAPSIPSFPLERQFLLREQRLWFQRWRKIGRLGWFA